MIKVEDKDPLIIDETITDANGCINPFCQDSYHMGVQIGRNVTVMMTNHQTEECNYIIVVNNRTGERKLLLFNE